MQLFLTLWCLVVLAIIGCGLSIGIIILILSAHSMSNDLQKKIEK